MADVQRQIDRLALLQIDSINVVARAHYLPLFSRWGSYDTTVLDRAAHQAPRRLFEYWGHAASLIDVNLYAALQFRMANASNEAWGGIRWVAVEHPQLIEEVRHVVAEHGPVTAREAETLLAQELPQRTREHWGWNWSVVKTALEWLLWSGRISAAQRNAQFERAYLPIEHVVPPHLMAAPAMTEAAAVVELTRRAIGALGVATDRCLADYFRLPVTQVRPALAILRERELIRPVLVGDDRRPAWLSTAARAGRPRAGGTLLSPFDSMVFERQRLEWLFDFEYRIEIYVPEAKRRYGYYVYPFLYGDHFAARVDLRANRQAGQLEVRGCWFEPGHDRLEVREALTVELRRLADWQNLDQVVGEVLPRTP